MLLPFAMGLYKVAKKRRYIGCRSKEHCFYAYPEGEYVREVLDTDESDCVEYRVVPVKHKPGRKLLICITNKKGPHGGKTKALALLRKKEVVERKKDLPQKAKELAEKLKEDK